MYTYYYDLDYYHAHEALLLNVQSAYKRSGTGTANSHFLRFWSLPDKDAQTKWQPKPAAA